MKFFYFLKIFNFFSLKSLTSVLSIELIFKIFWKNKFILEQEASRIILNNSLGFLYLINFLKIKFCIFFEKNSIFLIFYKFFPKCFSTKMMKYFIFYQKKCWIFFQNPLFSIKMLRENNLFLFIFYIYFPKYFSTKMKKISHFYRKFFIFYRK